MKRPIPEGVNAPNDKATILGWGDEFQSAGGFEGWLYLPSLPRHGWIGPARMDGRLSNGLYAALSDSGVVRLNRESKWKLEDHDYTGELSDAGSEVARLNRDPLMDSVFGKDNCKGDKALGTECGSCERCKSYGWTQEDPRDGAIRGLVQEWRESADDIERTGNLDNRYERGAIETLRGCADELEADLGKEKG